MNSVSVDIKDMLESSSVAIATFAVDLFISEFPDYPDQCICLKDTMSWKEPETNGSNMEYPGLQVLVRGTPSGYNSAYALARSIQEEFHALSAFRQGAYYISIAVSTETTYIGRDETNRCLFSINFIICRKP